MPPNNPNNQARSVADVTFAFAFVLFDSEQDFEKARAQNLQPPHARFDPRRLLGVKGKALLQGTTRGTQAEKKHINFPAEYASGKVIGFGAAVASQRNEKVWKWAKWQSDDDKLFGKIKGRVVNIFKLTASEIERAEIDSVRATALYNNANADVGVKGIKVSAGASGVSPVTVDANLDDGSKFELKIVKRNANYRIIGRKDIDYDALKITGEQFTFAANQDVIPAAASQGQLQAQPEKGVIIAVPPDGKAVIEGEVNDIGGPKNAASKYPLVPDSEVRLVPVDEHGHELKVSAGVLSELRKWRATGPGANVIQRIKGTTQKGEFKFDVPPGRYIVEARAKGYKNPDKTNDVSDNRQREGHPQQVIIVQDRQTFSDVKVPMVAENLKLSVRGKVLNALPANAAHLDASAASALWNSAAGADGVSVILDTHAKATSRTEQGFQGFFTFQLDNSLANSNIISGRSSHQEYGIVWPQSNDFASILTHTNQGPVYEPILLAPVPKPKIIVTASPNTVTQINETIRITAELEPDTESFDSDDLRLRDAKIKINLPNTNVNFYSVKDISLLESDFRNGNKRIEKDIQITHDLIEALIRNGWSGGAFQATLTAHVKRHAEAVSGTVQLNATLRFKVEGRVFEHKVEGRAPDAAYNATDLKVVAGANVTIGDRRTPLGTGQTDAEGRFSIEIEKLPKSSEHVVAELNGKTYSNTHYPHTRNTDYDWLQICHPRELVYRPVLIDSGEEKQPPKLKVRFEPDNRIDSIGKRIKIIGYLEPSDEKFDWRVSRTKTIGVYIEHDWMHAQPSQPSQPASKTGGNWLPILQVDDKDITVNENEIIYDLELTPELLRAAIRGNGTYGWDGKDWKIEIKTGPAIGWTQPLSVESNLENGLNFKVFGAVVSTQSTQIINQLSAQLNNADSNADSNSLKGLLRGLNQQSEASGQRTGVDGARAELVNIHDRSTIAFVTTDSDGVFEMDIRRPLVPGWDNFKASKGATDYVKVFPLKTDWLNYVKIGNEIEFGPVILAPAGQGGQGRTGQGRAANAKRIRGIILTEDGKIPVKGAIVAVVNKNQKSEVRKMSDDKVTQLPIQAASGDNGEFELELPLDSDEVYVAAWLGPANGVSELVKFGGRAERLEVNDVKVLLNFDDAQLIVEAPDVGSEESYGAGVFIRQFAVSVPEDSLASGNLQQLVIGWNFELTGVKGRIPDVVAHRAIVTVTDARGVIQAGALSNFLAANTSGFAILNKEGKAQIAVQMPLSILDEAKQTELNFRLKINAWYRGAKKSSAPKGKDVPVKLTQQVSSATEVEAEEADLNLKDAQESKIMETEAQVLSAIGSEVAKLKEQLAAVGSAVGSFRQADIAEKSVEQLKQIIDSHKPQFAELRKLARASEQLAEQQKQLLLKESSSINKLKTELKATMGMKGRVAPATASRLAETADKLARIVASRNSNLENLMAQIQKLEKQIEGIEDVMGRVYDSLKGRISSETSAASKISAAKEALQKIDSYFKAIESNLRQLDNYLLKVQKYTEQLNLPAWIEYIKAGGQMPRTRR